MARFLFPYPAEAWVPLALTTAQREIRDTRFLWVFGRLRPGVRLSTSASELQAISQQQAAAYPEPTKLAGQTDPTGGIRHRNLTRQYTLSRCSRGRLMY